jgi:hypothetical protein
MMMAIWMQSYGFGPASGLYLSTKLCKNGWLPTYLGNNATGRPYIYIRNRYIYGCQISSKMSDKATKNQGQPTGPTPLQTPFASIALALSGGGFRAASFSLGTLSYLNAVAYAPGQTLLGNVRFIASASGGTITNASYVLSVYQGQSFADYYRGLRSQLKGESLLKAALEVLNNDSEWEAGDAYKGRTLINAFAKVYDAKLFKGATLGHIWNSGETPKLYACFNATEFYKGMSFRFQTPANASDKGYWGNKYLFIDRNSAAIYQKIKLGDVLAASSCFPAGFEPILYPRDFAYRPNGTGEGLSKEALMGAMVVAEYDNSRQPLDKTVAMMDGGITDNQGLYSAMVADERERRQGHGFDLIMSTDVASYFMNPVDVPVEQPPKGWRGRNISYYIAKVKKGLATAKGLTIAAGLMLAGGTALALLCQVAALAALGWVLAGMAVTVLIVALFVLRKANGNAVIKAIAKDSANDDIGALLNSVGAGSGFSPSVIDKLSYYLSRTRLNVLELMAKARITSVISMVMDINLKQVRRLIYELLYGNAKWEDRRSQNAIYDMSSFNKNNRQFRINKKEITTVSGGKVKFSDAEKALLLDGCGAIETVAEAARKMGTTLWFDDKDDNGDMLKKIISCGQFTTCGNLLEYVMTVQKRGLGFAPEVEQRLQDIRNQLEGHWQRFKADPYFLYEGKA